MSRLARAGRDWHQLIELCSLAGALLAVLFLMPEELGAVSLFYLGWLP